MSGRGIAVRTTRTPDDLSTAAKREPSFVSWSQTTTCGTRSMVAFLAWLRAPLVGRRIGHRRMEDRSATQVQEEEYEHLAEPHVERLHEVTRPSHVV